MFLRSPCKNSKPYNTPLCHLSNGGWFIGVILPVHWGYIAGSSGLYSGSLGLYSRFIGVIFQFIGVIFPVHWGYIPVHWGYIFETKIVAYGMLSDTVCTAPLGPKFKTPHFFCNTLYNFISALPFQDLTSLRLILSVTSILD